MMIKKKKSMWCILKNRKNPFGRFLALLLAVVLIFSFSAGRGTNLYAKGSEKSVRSPGSSRYSSEMFTEEETEEIETETETETEKETSRKKKGRKSHSTTAEAAAEITEGEMREDPKEEPADKEEIPEEAGSEMPDPKKRETHEKAAEGTDAPEEESCEDPAEEWDAPEAETEEESDDERDEDTEETGDELPDEWDDDTEESDDEPGGEWDDDTEESGNDSGDEWNDDMEETGDDSGDEWDDDTEESDEESWDEWNEDIEETDEESPDVWDEDSGDDPEELREDESEEDEAGTEESGESDPEAGETTGGFDSGWMDPLPETAGEPEPPSEDGSAEENSDLTQEESSAEEEAEQETGDLSETESFDESGMRADAGAGEDIASGISGSCQWVIDAAGCLRISPAEGEEGTLGRPSPWSDYAAQIVSVRIFGRVHAGRSAEKMFYNCSEVTDMDLTGLDISGAVSARQMFSGCRKLKELNLGDMFDTSSVTTMEDMFRNLQSLGELDLGENFDTSRVTSMRKMFSGCESLRHIDLGGKFDTSSVKSMHAMFSDCSSAEYLNLGELFDTSSATEMTEIFAGDSSLKELDLGEHFDTSRITSTYHMFSECSGLTSLSLGDHFDTSRATDFFEMFYGCSSLVSLDLGGHFSTENARRLERLFQGCSSLETIDLGEHFDTSAAVSISYMFADCRALRDIRLGDLFDTSSVTNMQYMFYRDQSLVELDLGGKFRIADASIMKNMFQGCTALVKLDPRESFSTSNADIMPELKGLTSLKKIYLADSFRFSCPGNSTSLPAGSWMHTDSGEVFEAEDLAQQYVGGDMSGWYYRTQQVTFHGNGGIASPRTVQAALDASSLTEEEMPSAELRGWRFAGWFTAKTGGEELHPGDVLTQDIYYAHWKDPIRYRITLDPNGGQGNRVSTELSYDESYRLRPDQFSNGNLSLTGWSTRRDGGGLTFQADEEVMQLTDEEEEEIILYAQWSDRIVVLSFDLNYDAPEDLFPPDCAAVRGEPVGDSLHPVSPVREEWWFAGWYTDPEGGELLTSNSVFTENSVLYAHWLPRLKISFDYNDGSGRTLDRETADSNGRIGNLPVICRTAWIFDGWFTLEEGGEEVAAETVVTENTTLFAHWKQLIQYDASGGDFRTTVPEEQRVIHDISHVLIPGLPEVARYGFTLEGWYTPGGEKVQAGEISDLSETGILTARWNPVETVRISFDADGGSPVSDVEIYRGGTLPEIPVSRRDDSAFGGWYIGDIRVTAETVFEEDAVLRAHWNSWCTLRFMGNGGTVNPSEAVLTVPCGDRITILPGAYRNGYVHTGWFQAEDGSGEMLSAGTEVSEDRTYYAGWRESGESVVLDDVAVSFSADWKNTSNSSVDNLAGNLNFHPDGISTVTAMLHIRFEVNKDVEGVLPPGAARIRIPRQIFEDYDGNPLGTCNIASQMSMAPATKPGMYFNYTVDGDFFVISNSAALGGNTGVDATISYTAEPVKIPGGAMNYDGKSWQIVPDYDFFSGNVPVLFEVDREPDGIPELSETRNLTLEMHTKVTSWQSKSFTSVYYRWNDSWGTPPEDAERYFYINWNLYEEIQNSTNQQYRVSWSEDTVHDGTVVCLPEQIPADGGFIVPEKYTRRYYNPVILKYPLSLLREAGPEGLPVHNEAVVTEQWKSGYTVRHLVEADTVIYTQSYPEGEFTKHILNWTTEEKHIISGGQEDILDDHREVVLPYQLTYDGGPGMTPQWNEEEQTYSLPVREIVIRDGLDGDILYNSGQAADKRSWDPETGNAALGDGDYYIRSLEIRLTEFDGRLDGVTWSERYRNTTAQVYEPVEILIRRKGSDAPEHFTALNLTPEDSGRSQYVYLPDNAVGFEVRHKTAFYSTELKVNPEFVLRPSPRVCSLIRGDLSLGVTSQIKNAAVCTVYHADNTALFFATNRGSGPASAWKEMYELNRSVTNLRTVKITGAREDTVFDVDRSVQDAPMMIAGYNENTSGRLKKITSAVFYDLLPAGTWVDENCITGTWLKKGNPGRNNAVGYQYVPNSIGYSLIRQAETSPVKLSRSSYSVQFIRNWKESGRTMMVIRAGVPEEMSVTGFIFYYSLSASYEKLMEAGTHLENDVAFVNTTENHSAYDGRSGILSAIAQPQYYQSIEDTWGPDAAYAKVTSNFIPVDAYSWGFYKMVKAGNEYVHSDRTALNTEYSYRLTYAQSDNTRSDRIIFYDILERGTDEKHSQWHGFFEGVDLGEIRNLISDGTADAHCDPVVYYSTRNREEFTGADYNLENSSTWSRQMPSDKNTVTAVAVDCSRCADGSDFVLAGRNLIHLTINMRAPADRESAGKTAYNEAVCSARKTEQGDEPSGEPTPQYSDTELTLTDPEPEIHKISDPETGTSDSPCQVLRDQDILYTISLTNSGDRFSLRDVTAEDTIPAGLRIRRNEISVWTGDRDTSVNIELSPRVSIERDGQHLIFKVEEILPGETIHIDIPAVAEAEEAVFENTASVTSVNGMERSIRSETTWHETRVTPPPVVPTGMHLPPACLITALLMLSAAFMAAGKRVRRQINP